MTATSKFVAVEVDVLMIFMVELIACVTGSFEVVCVVGNTIWHPESDGVATHCARVGSTTLQPASVGVALHCAKVGKTLLQPGRDGVTAHWLSVGDGFCVTLIFVTLLLGLFNVTEPASAFADSDTTVIIPLLLWVMLPPVVFKLSALPFPPLIAALMAIPLVALRVSGVSLSHVIGSTTVMKPLPVPLALVVDTMTDEPASKLSMVATVSRESLTVPDAMKVKGPVDAEVSVPTMPAAVAEA